jgi:sulfate permease, SulP family
VVLDAEVVAFVDVSAVEMLDEVGHDLEARGVRFLLARDVGHVRDVLRRAGEDPALQRLPDGPGGG